MQSAACLCCVLRYYVCVWVGVPSLFFFISPNPLSYSPSVESEGIQSLQVRVPRGARSQVILWPSRRAPHCRPGDKDGEKEGEPAQVVLSLKERETTFSRAVTAPHRPALPGAPWGRCLSKAERRHAGHEHIDSSSDQVSRGGREGETRARRDGTSQGSRAAVRRAGTTRPSSAHGGTAPACCGRLTAPACPGHEPSYPSTPVERGRPRAGVHPVQVHSTRMHMYTTAQVSVTHPFSFVRAPPA